MTAPRIQSFLSLRNEMKAVARGEMKAPANAAKPSFETAAALMRLLTAENRKLLALIHDHAGSSIADLAKLTGRAQPNLTRTIKKLEAAGFIETEVVGRKKTLKVTIEKLKLEIDPYSLNDRLYIVAAPSRRTSMAEQVAGSAGEATSKNARYVVRHGSDWAVKAAGADRASGVFSTRREAERYAKQVVGNLGGGEVYVQGRDGRWRDAETQGCEPFPSRDVKGRKAS